MKFFTLLFSFSIGLLCFWFGYKFIALYFKVKRKWIPVKASVLSKTIALHERTSASGARYAVKVQYRYSYGQQEYTNATVYLAELLNGQVNHRQSSAQKVVDGIDSIVSVYVNPENPQQSVLFCTGIALYLFLFVMGFFSLLMGLSYLN